MGSKLINLVLKILPFVEAFFIDILEIVLKELFFEIIVFVNLHHKNSEKFYLPEITLSTYASEYCLAFLV